MLWPDLFARARFRLPFTAVPTEMDWTTDRAPHSEDGCYYGAGTLFGNDPRYKGNVDLNIINHCASTNLETVAH